MGNSVSIDVGNLFATVAVFLRASPDPKYSLPYVSMSSNSGTVYFLQIPKDSISSLLTHTLYDEITHSEIPVVITGSKYNNSHELICRTLSITGISVTTHSCLIKAANFFNTHCPESFFNYSKTAESHRSTFDVSVYPLFPCLIMNIRSGSSVYRADTPTDFKKIGGSPIGCSTYWGLIKLSTNFTSPSEALKAATCGDNSTVDLTVGDIYGGDYSDLGLSSDLIASSCGKMHSKAESEDISRSIAVMITYNVSQLAYMYSQIEDIGNILLVGNYVGSDEFMKKAQESVNFHSKGKSKLIFSSYSCYMGALGALLYSLEGLNSATN